MTTGEFVRRLCVALGIEQTEDWQTILAQAEIAGNTHLHIELARQAGAGLRARRNALIDEARECWLAAGLPIDVDPDVYPSFDTQLTLGLHSAFPFLDALHTRLIASYRVDVETVRIPGSVDGVVIEELDIMASPETVLARDAYVAAMRAVIHGHKLGSAT